jgi:hypothetical protein
MVNPDIIATLAAYITYYDYRRLSQILYINAAYNQPEYAIVILQGGYCMRIYLTCNNAIIAQIYTYIARSNIPIISYRLIADERTIEIYGIVDDTEYYAIYGDISTDYLSGYRIDMVYIKNMDSSKINFLKYNNNILINDNR